MQTLGLSGETRRSDGRLKSIFWPAVENAWDVNYLGQQGFWICVVVALIQIFAGVVSRNPVMLAWYLATAMVFLTGACGVREASWPAAAMVFGLSFVGLLSTLASGQIPGVLAIVTVGLLLSNTRAAFLASEWRPAREGEDQPTRFSETFRDKFVDQWPAKAWPVLQAPFFALAALLLLLTLVGLGTALWHRLGVFAGPLQP